MQRLNCCFLIFVVLLMSKINLKKYKKYHFNIFLVKIYYPPRQSFNNYSGRVNNCDFKPGELKKLTC
jgi:hypothetical protein